MPGTGVKFQVADTAEDLAGADIDDFFLAKFEKTHGQFFSNPVLLALLYVKSGEKEPRRLTAHVPFAILQVEEV